MFEYLSKKDDIYGICRKIEKENEIILASSNARTVMEMIFEKVGIKTEKNQKLYELVTIFKSKYPYSKEVHKAINFLRENGNKGAHGEEATVNINEIRRNLDILCKWYYYESGFAPIKTTTQGSSKRSKSTQSKTTNNSYNFPEPQPKKLDGTELYEQGAEQYNYGNYENAINSFYEATRLGSADAAYMYGVCVRDGLGVYPDRILALKWFMIAIELGSEEAKTAKLTLENSEYHTDYMDPKSGYTITRPPHIDESSADEFDTILRSWPEYYTSDNYKKYAKEIEFAALSNDPVACAWMGYFCENGIVFAQNYEIAYQWYSNAWKYGYQPHELRVALPRVYNILHPGEVYGEDQNKTSSNMSFYLKAGGILLAGLILCWMISHPYITIGIIVGILAIIGNILGDNNK